MTTILVIVDLLLILWLLFELRLIRQTRRIHGQEHDAGTFSGMWWTIMVTVLLSNILMAWGHIHFHQFILPMWVEYIGLSLMIMGLALRWYSIQYLGQYFTVRVMIQTQHELITSGPYRWVRHPSYTGAWLVFIGVGFVTTSGLALLVWIFMPFFALLRRIRIEEAALHLQFGKTYDEYCKRTWRLIPFIF